MVRAQQRSAAIADAAERGPARLRRRARLPLSDHPDDRFRPGPGNDPGRDRPAGDAGDRVPRLPDLVPRRRSPRPPVVLRALRAPRRASSAWSSGEGLAGWVVKTRRSAFIKEQALKDPRVKYFPEFEEERFQSLVSVPVFDRDGGVMGVISLHAEAPHEFVRADLDLPRAHGLADRRARSRTPGCTRRPRRGSTC